METQTQVTIDYSEYVELKQTIENLLEQNETMKQRIDLMVGQERKTVETLAKLVDDIVWGKDCGLMEQYQNE